MKKIIPVIASVLTALSSWAGLNELQVYGIATFGGGNQCGTSGQSHSVHTTTAAAFAAPFISRKANGLWDEIHTRNNTSARTDTGRTQQKIGGTETTSPQMLAWTTPTSSTSIRTAATARGDLCQQQPADGQCRYESRSSPIRTCFSETVQATLR